MKQLTSRQTNAAALAIAAVAAWRLPNGYGLTENDSLFAGSAITLILLAGLYLLLKNAFQITDRRLNRTAYFLGGMFAIVTVVCADVRANNGFSAFRWLPFLYGVLAAASFTAVYGAALALLFQGMDRLSASPAKAESVFSKVLGNWAFAFALLLVCWLPVWLAFWPGIFVSDCVTQFHQYYNYDFSAHHPLLHTLLLGWCVMTGVDLDPEGYSTLGVAIYSMVQMVLLAAMMAWALRWLRKHRAPLWSRVCVTLLFALFPLYSSFSFSCQKDILFSGLSLLFLLELVDVWQDGFKALRSPWRIVRLTVITVLMLLMRNNGVYALALLLPFAVAWAKGARVRLGALLLACMALYFGVNTGLKAALEAKDIDRVEMLSIPLQQMARTLQQNPDALPDDEARELIDAIYPYGFEEYYLPSLADPVKWASDYDVVDERMGDILSLWARMLPANLKPYMEAFLIQNLPYLLPGSEMIYYLDTESRVSEMEETFPLVEQSRIPALKELYRQYDKTLTLLGLPGVRLLSDAAFQIWLAMAGLALAVYRRQKGYMAAFTFILTVWFTCLIGPVAILRYLLIAFYGVPVLLAGMLAAPECSTSLSPKKSD